MALSYVKDCIVESGTKTGLWMVHNHTRKLVNTVRFQIKKWGFFFFFLTVYPAYALYTVDTETKILDFIISVKTIYVFNFYKL